MPPTHIEYKIKKLDPVEGTIVGTHRGDFLVITAKLPDLRTVIFQKHKTYNCWVYRRSISGSIDPEAAVTGHILSSWSEVDVFSELEKRLEGREKAYWHLIAENSKLKAQLKAREKRSKKRG